MNTFFEVVGSVVGLMILGAVLFVLMCGTQNQSSGEAEILRAEWSAK